MFWRFGSYANVSTIDTLLDKPDVTLEELLDEPDLIQELKQHNTKLIEYLRDENVLNRLLNYVTAPGPRQDEDSDVACEASPETEKEGTSKDKDKAEKQDMTEDEQEKAEKTRLKYSYVACEVLSSETWSLLESMMVNTQHLKQFWDFMRRPPPLDPLQAGYFTKVNETLFEKKTEEMLEFFKTLDEMVPAILQHVDCPMVMDLLLKIISLEKAEGGQGIVDWLQTKGLIPILLSYLSPEYPSSTQTSAGDFLKAIITISANASQNEQSCIGPNSLTRELVSETCMETLITSMLRGGNPLTVGVGIVIEVIRKNNSDYDPDVGGGQDSPPTTHDPIYLGTLLRMFAKHVPDFMDLILSSKHTVMDGSGIRLVDRGQLKSAWGNKIEPLGFDRFKTCELMAELLHCSNMGLLNEKGSEEYVRQRDAERERLRSEGTLNARREGDSGIEDPQHSSAFTNGLSSPRTESAEGTRRFEIANAGDEDGFEDVASSGVLNDEVKDDFDEKIDEKERSPNEAFTTIQDRPRIDLSDEFMDEPLSSPRLKAEPGVALPESASSPVNPNMDPTSPTAGLTDEVRRFSLEKDTEMTGNDKSEDSSETSRSKEKPKVDLDSPVGLSPHAEDTPAPLFASSSNPPPRDESVSPKTVEGEHSGNAIDSTLGEGGDSSQSVMMSGNDQLFEPHIQTDDNGKPVVGDYLKIMFVENKVVPTILSFFFRFPWNNFLHNVVYDVVQQVFNGPMDRGFNRSVAIDLFETGRITDQIVEGQRRNDEAQTESNMRLGYMGHLTLVAEEVVKFSERHPAELLSQTVMDRVTNARWCDYVEKTLSETRERDNAILGGVRPDMSVGPRQAVLNAVSGQQGYSLANAGLNGGNDGGQGGLDTIDLANTGSASSGSFGLGSGSSLLSGFGSSSDDEDEEMEESEEDETVTGRVIPAGEDTSTENQNSSANSIPLIPPPPAPLNINNPSRARRQLQARLLSKQQAEKGNNNNNDADRNSSSPPKENARRSDLDEDPDSLSFPPAEDFGAGSGVAVKKQSPLHPIGLGGMGKGFASLFSSSGNSSSKKKKGKNASAHGQGQGRGNWNGKKLDGFDGLDGEEEEGNEDEERYGIDGRGESDSSEDDNDEERSIDGSTEDDDESLLHAGDGARKGAIMSSSGGRGIFSSPLPLPEEFEEDSEEMGEMVGPTMVAGDNSSDDESVGPGGEEATSSDEEVPTPKDDDDFDKKKGFDAATSLKAAEREEGRSPVQADLMPKPLGASPKKTPAPPVVSTATAATTSQTEGYEDDDDDEGLVEIKMGSPGHGWGKNGHSRSGSGNGSSDADEMRLKRKGSLGKKVN